MSEKNKEKAKEIAADLPALQPTVPKKRNRVNKDNISQAVTAKYPNINPRKYTEEDWVKDIHPILLARRQMLMDTLNIKQLKIENLPQGHIRIHPRGNSIQYYECSPSTSTNGKYLKEKHLKTAQKIQQGKYDKNFIREATKELEFIDKYLYNIEPQNIDTIYARLSNERKKLVTPIFRSKEEMITDWESIEYEPGDFSKTTTEFYTRKNERVRSKTEREIANMLAHYGVPYLYEYPIELSGGIYRPDFHCLNIRTRKVYIWEHHGMMDDLSYARDNIAKIQRYEMEGYLPGINYITTFETSKNPLPDKIIKLTIENYLL